ncbi:hypothetical protein EZV62_007329 [Acer yangbiense]|uniref:MYB-CC type transcription factor LHEQLE-containing domain-containing protein n=1 Tax=Acer yangbiense TaxID=1000413 RepID=A0A5C7IA42_9ROSI|nr:hypothetical protein EZV62_007329 [Acer yangbiense]
MQKYRTARHKPGPSKETSEKNISSTEEMKALDLKTTMGITEALRLQMEVQKRLHDPSASLSKSEQNSPKNEKSDATEVDLAKTGAGTGQANTAQQESSPSSSKKQKAPQTEAAEDLVVDDSGHTNAKWARTSETSEPSAKSPSD